MTFIHETNPSDPLKREDYWRCTLKTMTPFALNIEESTFINFCLYWSLMLYISARTGSFLGLEHLDTIIIILDRRKKVGENFRREKI